VHPTYGDNKLSSLDVPCTQRMATTSCRFGYHENSPRIMRTIQRLVRTRRLGQPDAEVSLGRGRPVRERFPRNGVPCRLNQQREPDRSDRKLLNQQLFQQLPGVPLTFGSEGGGRLLLAPTTAADAWSGRASGARRGSGACVSTARTTPGSRLAATATRLCVLPLAGRRSVLFTRGRRSTATTGFRSRLFATR